MSLLFFALAIVNFLSCTNGNSVAVDSLSSTVAPWGLSLSGNGFVAMAHGAGVYKALSNAGYLKDLATISSVSGGSLLNTLLAFSSSFRDSLVAPGDIGDWFMDFQDLCSASQRTMQLTACMIENGPQNCAADAVGQVIYPSSIRNLPATSEHRSASTNAELLICTNIATTSLMSDQTTSTVLNVSEIEIPVYYSIPGPPTDTDNGSSNHKWHVPLGLGAQPLVKHSHGQTAALALPSVVAVDTVASMSGASSGAAGAPAIKAASTPQSQFCEDWFPCPNFKSKYLDNTNYSNVAENAVLSDPGQGPHCSFPSVRFIDGSYSDNMGLALNIGHLQSKYAGKKLRVFGANSNQCDRSSDPHCLTSIRESSFRNLFADSPYPNISSEGWMNGGTGMRIPSVSKVIFMEAITDQQALGKTVSRDGITVFTGTFTTVDNKAFGVVAGTQVQLVVFNANSQASAAPSTSTERRALNEAARSSFLAATKILSDMIEPVGGISSKVLVPAAALKQPELRETWQLAPACNMLLAIASLGCAVLAGVVGIRKLHGSHASARANRGHEGHERLPLLL